MKVEGHVACLEHDSCPDSNRHDSHRSSISTRSDRKMKPSASVKPLLWFIIIFFTADKSNRKKKKKNMEKTKRISLGVQKKTKPTKQNKKKFLNNVLHYLKSDCYMFAPLISSSFSASGNHFFYFLMH